MRCGLPRHFYKKASILWWLGSERRYLQLSPVFVDHTLQLTLVRNLGLSERADDLFVHRQLLRLQIEYQHSTTFLLRGMPCAS